MPKQRRVAEEGPADAAAASDGTATHPSEEIPTGEPIIPPYNGSKILLIARLLHKEKTAGTSVDLGGEGESDDDFIEEITTSPPFQYYYGEDLEDDPQLTLGNL